MPPVQTTTGSTPSGSASRSLSRIAKAVAVVALTALWVHARARSALREHPPFGKFLEVDGVRLHYVDEGDGPPVVLLHGNTVQMDDLMASGLVDRLKQRHRVIVFDRPGFGHSERPRDRQWTPQAQAALLREALARLGIEGAVFVGHSWGTLVALAMALDAPESVRGLVLVSGYYYPTARIDVPFAALSAIPVVGDAARYTVAALSGRMLLDAAVRAMFAPARMPPGYLHTVPREMLVRPSQIRAAAEDAAMMIPAVAQFQHAYARIDAAVALLAGEGDRIVDMQAHSARLLKDLPQSTLVIVEGAGHMVHFADPDAIADAVAKMWDAAPVLPD